MKYARATFLVFIIVIAGSACSLQHESSLDAIPTQPTPSSGGGGQGGGLLGTWASPAEIPALDPKSCNFLEWKVSTQTATQIAGQFSAVCMTNVVISGNASGQLATATTMTFTISGTASLPSAPGCSFSASGDGTIEGNEALHLRFTGTSCLGPFSGSRTLRRPPPPARRSRPGVRGDQACGVAAPRRRRRPADQEWRREHHLLAGLLVLAVADLFPPRPHLQGASRRG